MTEQLVTADEILARVDREVDQVWTEALEFLEQFDVTDCNQTPEQLQQRRVRFFEIMQRVDEVTDAIVG